MSGQPILRTARLVLRPFTLADADDVERIAGAREIADTTMTIPHPYPPGAAKAWIERHPAEWEGGTGVTFAVIDERGSMVAAVGLGGIDREHAHAELGYWTAVEHWGKGYATEASRALMHFGFDRLHLHRIQARHLVRNRPSGRVMEKLGMRFEGVQRGWIRKWGVFEDVVMRAALAPEWGHDGAPAGNAPAVGIHQITPITMSDTTRIIEFEHDGHRFHGTERRRSGEGGLETEVHWTIRMDDSPAMEFIGPYPYRDDDVRKRVLEWYAIQHPRPEAG